MQRERERERERERLIVEFSVSKMDEAKTTKEDETGKELLGIWILIGMIWTTKSIKTNWVFWSFGLWVFGSSGLWAFWYFGLLVFRSFWSFWSFGLFGLLVFCSLDLRVFGFGWTCLRTYTNVCVKLRVFKTCYLLF